MQVNSVSKWFCFFLASTVTALLNNFEEFHTSPYFWNYNAIITFLEPYWREVKRRLVKIYEPHPRARPSVTTVTTVPVKVHIEATLPGAFKNPLFSRFYFQNYFSVLRRMIKYRLWSPHVDITPSESISLKTAIKCVKPNWFHAKCFRKV